MLAQKLLGAMAGGPEDKLYSDDVFSAHTYVGTGSSQTIANGIDLAGEGGLVWLKRRDSGSAHNLYDTVRGVTKYLGTDTASAEQTLSNGVTAFNSNGFTLGADGSGLANFSSATYISHTFRKSPKFFDVVTYTGNGVAGRQIPHALGSEVGMVIVKRTSATADWRCLTRTSTDWALGIFNSTSALGAGSPFLFGDGVSFHPPTSTNFTVSGHADMNTNGASYVAYLFAHDTSADGIVQCGSYEATGASNTIELGWEPQFMLWRPANQAEHWRILDTSRGWANGGNDANLYANASTTEASNEFGHPTATGAFINNIYTSGTYIYLAIRRPNKPPTTGTEVYNAVARTGTGTTPTNLNAGFATDLVSVFHRDSGQSCTWVDKLRGVSSQLFTSTTGAELTGYSGITQFSSTGATVYDAPGAVDMNQLGYNYINHFFKRAPGFFDVVCYTGTGIATSFSHSLGVVPELMIFKNRSSTSAWYAFSSHLSGGYGSPGINNRLILNLTNAQSTENLLGADPNCLYLATSNSSPLSANNNNFVAYLFATLPGISKVGSYTGDGSSQTINCGFTTGARFILIKATSTSGDWLVADASRGIIAGNDPRLSLNTTSAEVTTEDWLDPDSTGFIVNQVAGSSANASGVSYIFLAIS